MSISAHFQQISFRGEVRSTKTRVGRSLTCCKDESIEVLSLQSGVGGDQRRPRLAHKARRGRPTAVPSRAGTYTPSRTVWRWRVANVQPVQFVMEDVRQTPVELPSTSDDSSGGGQDPLQLKTVWSMYEHIRPRGIVTTISYTNRLIPVLYFVSRNSQRVREQTSTSTYILHFIELKSK